MDIVSSCPLTVARFGWGMSNGAPALTVVCKATVVLLPVESVLASQQDPVLVDDSYWEIPFDKNPPIMTDLVPYKGRVDVVVVGHVYAPQKKPVRTLAARLILGSIEKVVEVHGGRFLMLTGELREGPMWTEQRLGWERSAGGPDTNNPVGMRFDAQDALGATHVPHFQPTNVHFSRWGDTFPTIGLSPIPPSWPSRVHKLYHNARTFLQRDWPSRPLPDPIDPSFFNVAPHDQQLEELRPGERLILDNLHPEHARLVTRLPALEPTATVTRQGRSPSALPLTCDTVWIDSDRGVCHMVWRGTIPGLHVLEPGQITISIDEETESRHHVPAAPSTFGRDGGTQLPGFGPSGPTTQGGLPFERTGAQPAVSLGSTMSSAPSPPTFGLRSDVATPPAGMRRRAITMDISPELVASLHATSPGTPFQSPFQAPPPQVLPGTIAQTPAPVAPPLPVQLPLGQPPPAPPGQVLPPSPTSSSIPAPPAPVASPAMGIVVPSPPLGSRPGGLGSSGSWSLSPPEGPPQGSIGERMATEQALAESKALLDKRGSDEPEHVGPLARAGTPVQDTVSAQLTPKRPPPQATKGETRDAVLLVWFDSAQVPRIRKKPAFREIIDALEEQDPDPELDSQVVGAPADIEEHRAMFEILTRATTSDGDTLQRLMVESVRDDGKFVSPLGMFAGELAFPFDELEILRATLIAVSPLVSVDEPLKAAVETAKEFLKTPDLTCSPAVAEGMTQRIRDAFGQGKRVVAPGYLDAQTERALLEQRHYQKRIVFGLPHIRCLLHMTGSAGPVPSYIPLTVAPKLPLFQRFRVRVIATGHVAEDQNETHSTALRILALARIASAPTVSAAPQQPPKRPS